MAENDSLRMVCLEPLLYAFPAPRTIAITLTEYEQHLRSERSLSPRRRQETLSAIAEFLDPVEAPLSTITSALLHTLLLDELMRAELLRPGSAPARCLTVSRVERFFRWATAQRYLARNPFADLAAQAAIHDGILRSSDLDRRDDSGWLA